MLLVIISANVIMKSPNINAAVNRFKKWNLESYTKSNMPKRNIKKSLDMVLSFGRMHFIDFNRDVK